MFANVSHFILIYYISLVHLCGLYAAIENQFYFMFLLVSRMLLTGKALISSFCEGSDSIFWYDDVLGFPEEEVRCLYIKMV